MDWHTPPHIRRSQQVIVAKHYQAAMHSPAVLISQNIDKQRRHVLELEKESLWLQSEINSLSRQLGMLDKSIAAKENAHDERSSLESETEALTTSIVKLCATWVLMPDHPLGTGEVPKPVSVLRPVTAGEPSCHTLCSALIDPPFQDYESNASQVYAFVRCVYESLGLRQDKVSLVHAGPDTEDPAALRIDFLVSGTDGISLSNRFEDLLSMDPASLPQGGQFLLAVTHSIEVDAKPRPAAPSERPEQPVAAQTSHSPRSLQHASSRQSIAEPYTRRDSARSDRSQRLSSSRSASKQAHMSNSPRTSARVSRAPSAVQDDKREALPVAAPQKSELGVASVEQIEPSPAALLGLEKWSSGIQVLPQEPHVVPVNATESWQPSQSLIDRRGSVPYAGSASAQDRDYNEDSQDGNSPKSNAHPLFRRSHLAGVLFSSTDDLDLVPVIRKRSSSRTFGESDQDVTATLPEDQISSEQISSEQITSLGKPRLARRSSADEDGAVEVSVRDTEPSQVRSVDFAVTATPYPAVDQAPVSALPELESAFLVTETVVSAALENTKPNRPPFASRVLPVQPVLVETEDIELVTSNVRGEGISSPSVKARVVAYEQRTSPTSERRASSGVGSSGASIRSSEKSEKKQGQPAAQETIVVQSAILVPSESGRTSSPAESVRSSARGNTVDAWGKKAPTVMQSINITRAHTAFLEPKVISDSTPDSMTSSGNVSPRASLVRQLAEATRTLNLGAQRDAAITMDSDESVSEDPAVSQSVDKGQVLTVRHNKRPSQFSR